MTSLLILPKDYTQHEEVKKMVCIYTGDSVDTTTRAYAEHFLRMGSWNAWISHLATGTDFISQEPLYSKYICVQENLGRANAGIVEQALHEGKPCFYLDSTGSFNSIVGVHQETDDWISGWKISYISELA
jgi:hypothetical protein